MTKNKPSISIITPSYNQEQYIERTIQSVVSQKGDFTLEYIIIDAKSTDNSLKIIKTYAKKYKFIKVICEKDNGQSDGINKGLKLATGDIVAWLNSDDVYLAGTLQKVVSYFMKNPNKRWLYGFVDVIDENDKPIMPFVTKYKLQVGRRFSHTRLLIENFISQPATFWKRDFMYRVGFLNEKLHLTMDYEYWLRMASVSKPGVIPKILTHFRRYVHSKSGDGFNPAQFEQQYAVMKRFTKNPFVRAAHKLNNQKIKLGYFVLK